MPAKSPAQRRLMAAKCHGKKAVKAKGLTKKAACEVLHGKKKKGR